MAFKVDKNDRRLISESGLDERQLKAFHSAMWVGTGDNGYISFEDNWWFIGDMREGRFTLLKAYEA